MGMDLALDLSSTLSWQIFSLDETSFRAEFGNDLRLGLVFAYGMFSSTVGDTFLFVVALNFTALLALSHLFHPQV